MIKRLQSAQNWVFDLDNTLYPPACDLFAQIDQRMTHYVAKTLQLPTEQARVLQKQYYLKHGTTLNGMMHNHDVDPVDFLSFVHDIDHSVLRRDAALRAAIQALPGNKFIFTNGSQSHAQNVLLALGLDTVFDGMIGIEATGFVPKPEQSAYDHLVQHFALDPELCVFFEDMERNLAPAFDMGFVTVLVTSDKDWSHEPEGARPASLGDTHAHVDFTTDNLSEFLQQLMQGKAQ
ncbi:Pyridoxal-5'-phosphate phosphatase, Alphaproteobacterial type [hydrothermal vent metagenome]|uniref:Pyridoxal-5'-phosphate phosphatase, Alphaproteobacterial type n=1 Tax=hydrothermal vent metagenome TaxID=652676 RepID=A0A3B0S279_9ZZZZ